MYNLCHNLQIVEDHQYLVEVEVEVEDLIVLSDTSSIIQGELTH